MRKILIVVFLLINMFDSAAQDKQVSVEKSVWGVQMGIPPIAVYNESRLADKFSLRSELYFGLAFKWGSGYETQWAVIPVIQVEPRFYFNIKRRSKRGKRIDGNSSDYFSLIIGTQPGFGFTSRYMRIYPGLFFIPAYGIRRNIGRHFNFEFACGIGYSWYFHKYENNITNEIYKETVHDVLFESRIAIGYRF